MKENETVLLRDYVHFMVTCWKCKFTLSDDMFYLSPNYHAWAKYCPNCGKKVVGVRQVRCI